MVFPVHLYFDNCKMEKNTPMNSELFWAINDEWEFFERRKAGLTKWCQVAEAKKKIMTAKKILASCRCL